MRLLLPNNKSSDNSNQICLIENGAIVTDTSAVLNEYFAAPTIDKLVLTIGALLLSRKRMWEWLLLT